MTIRMKVEIMNNYKEDEAFCATSSLFIGCFLNKYFFDIPKKYTRCKKNIE